MKQFIIIFYAFIFSGCANPISTRFTFKDLEGSTLTVELPKEMEAKNLIVEINSKEGRVTIKADAIQTLNTQTIRAQAERESAITKSISEGAVKGLIEGAAKSIVPIP